MTGKVAGPLNGVIVRKARINHGCVGYALGRHADDCHGIGRGETYVEFFPGSSTFESVRYSLPCALIAWGAIEGINT